MGTMIQASGIKPNEYGIPEDLSLSHPEIIKSIHRQYLDAGANVLTANTFGANPIKIAGEGCSMEEAKTRCAEYITAAVRLMQEAVRECEAAGSAHATDSDRMAGSDHATDSARMAGSDHATGCDHADTPHYIAWDTGQIGRLLEPMGDLSFDEAYESYKFAAMTAEAAGAEVAIIETMSDLYEMKAAILAVRENTNMAVVATATFQNNLRTLTGADVLTVVTYLEALRPDVLGFNCGGSLEEDEELARQFCAYSHTPVLAQPNAGLPVVQKGRTVFLVQPDTFAKSQLVNRKTGCALLGGCCGTTPAHIHALRTLCENVPAGDTAPAGSMPAEATASPAEAAPAATAHTENASVAPMPAEAAQNGHSLQAKNAMFVCSYNRTVQIGGSAGPQIIGERINPTGKKKCKEALLAGNMQFVLDEAESQINAGAQLLDVNVGLPGIDEAETMLRAVKTIQGAFSTPLQIDSSESAVLEKALRYYNGKALVNSVNGRRDVMDAVLPIVAHYGGSLVALCIDEAGIAPTAEGRAAVARKIITEAAKYGILPRDILIDTLTLTVSSQQKEALETLRAIEILKREYGEQGLRFVLGVSNISFGLPRRDIINSRFFAMALYSGLDACIINPLLEPMMETYYGYRALAGFDENCLSYIERYTGNESPYALAAKVASGAVLTEGSAASSAPAQAKVVESAPSAVPADATPQERALIDIICKGFKDKSSEAARSLLAAGKQPVEIIDRCIVPALDLVGKDFEKGTKFLPQLLLSADTVSNAFAVIKQHLEESGTGQESRGTIVIATVFGDIHDIGKNIVKAMLENYGYTVLDLGKNVPAEKIISAVLENDIKLVGLSALMTTTVGNMEDIIVKLRAALAEKGKTCKIMAGGAVLTADYATKIGADYYAKDAMASVAVAKEVFGS
ncbi:MAG: homocysteine S-methyltransferase family protein [Treponema sp.]|nr:homocysteine S-methyltransferase family protein [Treponema sp.]